MFTKKSGGANVRFVLSISNEKNGNVEHACSRFHVRSQGSHTLHCVLRRGGRNQTERPSHKVGEDLVVGLPSLCEVFAETRDLGSRAILEPTVWAIE